MWEKWYKFNKQTKDILQNAKISWCVEKNPEG